LAGQEGQPEANDGRPEVADSDTKEGVAQVVEKKRRKKEKEKRREEKKRKGSRGWVGLGWHACKKRVVNQWVTGGGWHSDDFAGEGEGKGKEVMLEVVVVMRGGDSGDGDGDGGVVLVVGGRQRRVGEGWWPAG